MPSKVANREPINFIVTYGEDANDHANWTVLGEYTFDGAAKRAIEGLLPLGWSGKLEYVYPNGIIEFRIFETSAHRGSSLPFGGDTDGGSVGEFGLTWDNPELTWDLPILIWS